MVDKQSTNAGLRELALFAGAGGGILGGKLLGWRTVCAVERDAYAAAVLAQRQNDGLLDIFPIWSDVETFDGRPWRGIVDVVSGGFPCQDISCAGKGAGIEGKQSGLWSEMARIIGEVRPRFAFVENVPALTARGLGRVLGDLAEMGYDAEWCVLGAHHVGAPHRRERMWIWAHASRAGINRINSNHIESKGKNRNWTNKFNGCNTITWWQYDPADLPTDLPNASCTRTLRKPEEMGSAQNKKGGTRHKSTTHAISCDPADLPDADCAGRKEQRCSEPAGTEHQTSECGNRWGLESRLGRVADGVAHRVDRLRAIGNGQVPAVAATAWEILSERRIKED